MKLPLIALAMATSFVVQAQPGPRCEDKQATVGALQVACTGVARMASRTLPVSTQAASPTDAETGQPSARRIRAQQEGDVIAARVLLRQRQPDLRQARQYAENRQRCAAALRVAELCGKHAGTFYCDAKGFQPIPEAARVKAAALNNSQSYVMERCVLDAKTAGP